MDKVEAFKFEKKVYSEQYEFNQKVAEQLKAALNTHNPCSRERQWNEGIALINKRNKKLMLADRYGCIKQTPWPPIRRLRGALNVPSRRLKFTR